MIQKIQLNLIIAFFRLRPLIKKANKENYKQNVKRFKRHYFEISSRIEKQSGIMAFHRMISIKGIALYKTLLDEFQTKEDLMDEIHQFMWKGPYGKYVRFLAFFIRRSKDPFKRFLKILGPKNEWFFPCPPWEKVPVEIENGIGWHQKKCPFFDYFKEEGVWQLCRSYGDLDERAAELLPNHIELKREKALCRGDDYCDFLYYKRKFV